MPETYHVKLSDGREFNVTTESGAPSEADVLAHLESAAPPSIPRDARGMPRVSSDLTDAPPSLVERTAANPALQSLAHPQSVTEMGALLIPSYVGASLNLGFDAMRSGLKAHPEMTGVTGRLKAAMSGIGERWRGPQPLTTEERAIAGTLRARPVPPPAATATATTPPSDIWDQMLAEQRPIPPPFHEQPLAQQMSQLPTTGPMPAAGRMSPPPYQPQTPFHELPLSQQMSRLPATGPTPVTGRLAMAPHQITSDAAMLKSLMQETATALNPWESNFLESVGSQIGSGRALSQGQSNALRSIYMRANIPR